MGLRSPAIILLVACFTLTAGPSASQTLISPSSDTYISHDNGCTFNLCDAGLHGEPDSLLIVSTREGCLRTIHALIRFDLSGLDPGRTVVSARLGLYAMYQNEYATNNFYVNSLTQGWVSSQVDWCEAADGQPWSCDGGGCYSTFGEGTFTVPIRHDGIPPADGSSQPYDEWFTIDVTTIVQAWASGEPNHGFVIRQKPSGGHNRNQELRFASRENSRSSLLAPQLEIIYDKPLARVSWSLIKARESFGKAGEGDSSPVD